MEKLIFFIKKHGAKSYYKYKNFAIIFKKKIIIEAIIFTPLLISFIYSFIIKKFMLSVLFQCLCFIVDGIYLINLYKSYNIILSDKYIPSYKYINKAKKGMLLASIVYTIFPICISIWLIIITINGNSDFDYNSIIRNIVMVETFLIVIYGGYSYFIVCFTDDYYFSTCYYIYYKDIEKVELIKEIKTLDGVLYHCIIYFYNGDKGVDKFFKDEFEFLKSKVIRISG